MDKIQSVEDLLVWQKAHKLVLEIYKVTSYFPQEEKFGMISQMRRAAISVPANISEGFKKRTLKDKVNFYNIAQGSLNELNYYIRLSKDLKYITDSEVMFREIDEIGKMLTGLIRSIRSI